MFIISRISLVIILSIFYLLSECPKEKSNFKKLLMKRYADSNDFQKPSDVEQIESGLKDTDISKKVLSSSSQNLKNNEDFQSSSGQSDTLGTIDTYTTDELKSIEEYLLKIITSFLSSLPERVPHELLNTLRFTLQITLMNYIQLNRKLSLDICYQNIKDILHDISKYFYSQYTLKTMKSKDVPLISYEIIKSIPYLWKNVASRGSNFPPGNVGWKVLLSPSEKLEALLLDYIIFVNEGWDTFRQIIEHLRSILSNPVRDLYLVFSIQDSIDLMQMRFSLFRYYREEFDIIYPDYIHQLIILMISIYNIQHFERMNDILDNLISKYMKQSNINDLSDFNDLRLDQVETSKNIKLFAGLVRKYILRMRILRLKTIK